MKSAAGNKVSRRRFMYVMGLSVLGGSLGSALAGCGDDQAKTTPQASEQPLTNPAGTPVSPSQTVTGGGATTGTVIAVKPIANPEEAATTFLKAWEESRYGDMYNLLATTAQNLTPRDKFVTRYGNIADEATLLSIKTSLDNTGSSTTPASGTTQTYEIPYTAFFKTSRAGDFSQKNTLQLVNERGGWWVSWQPANIFKGLTSDNLVRMNPSNPSRGSINDKTNQPLAKLGIIFSVFVVPGKIENEEQLLTTLNQVLGMDKNVIKDLYKNGQPDWRMDIKQLPGSTPQETLNTLIAIKGVGVDETEARSYPNGAAAANITGYLNAVNQDDLKKLASKGYREDDIVGRTGLEEWGEEILSGTKGGKLTIVQQDGKVLNTLSEKAAVPGSNITLTLDLNLQKNVEKILGSNTGSIVVMDCNDGSVLALTTFPTYDPNAFVTGISASQYNALNNDPRHPFQNRPINALLPVGSTLKVATMAAALERIGITPETTFTCTGHWTGLGESFAKDCYLKTGHGTISLYNGLVQSCDVVFYELGKRLDEVDPNLLPAVLKGFGLGTSTGLVGLTDSNGQVPDPQWKKDKLKQAWVRGDAVNLAIGQGYMLATPIQMAALYSGIANGGKIPVPRLVASSGDGANVQNYQAATKQTLPVSAANLDTIRKALQDVPRIGTAVQAFSGSKVKVAGKTGTAESGKENPHAWFCCYAPADKPKYTVVVVLEEAGEGSVKAAPLARQVIDSLTF